MSFLGNSAANEDMNFWVENIVGKEKLLIMSNFFFSHNVFKSCLMLMH